MIPTSALPAPGQSQCLESFTGELLIDGTLQCNIDELPVTPLTSNSAISHHAIKNGATYSEDISQRVSSSTSEEHGRSIEAELYRAVASPFSSAWDVAGSGKVAGELTNRLSIAIAQRGYKATSLALGRPLPPSRSYLRREHQP